MVTGGIASGKTTVSDHFEHLGVEVIDTDRIAHELVQPGMPALDSIIRAFGSAFQRPDGGLDREKMRQAIFSDPTKRARLESILHPLIAEEAKCRISKVRSPYCLLVVPLLAELGNFILADRILVVDADEHTQVERLMSRDSTSHQAAMSILKAQAKRQKRLQLADDVVVNDGSLAELKTRVEELHHKYLRLASR